MQNIEVRFNYSESKTGAFATFELSPEQLSITELARLAKKGLAKQVCHIAITVPAKMSVEKALQVMRFALFTENIVSSGSVPLGIYIGAAPLLEIEVDL